MGGESSALLPAAVGRCAMVAGRCRPEETIGVPPAGGSSVGHRAEIVQQLHVSVCEEPPSPVGLVVAAPVGRIHLLSEAECAILHAPTAVHPPHACTFVLVKTSVLLHANYENIAKLKYELALHERIDAMSSEAAEIAVGLADEKPQGQSSAATPSGAAVQPHLRYLQDGRLALIVSDPFGVTIRQVMAQQQAILTPKPSKVLAAAGHSESSRSRGGASALSRAHATPVFTLASIQTALETTLVLVLKLHRLHAMSLVHKSLHPDSIILNVDSRQTRFLDLTSASLLLKNKAEVGRADGRTDEAHEPPARITVVLTLACRVCSLVMAAGHESPPPFAVELALLEVRLREVLAAPAGLPRVVWLIVRCVCLFALRWFSPEQSGKANRMIDSRSDLYSLGAIMYQLLCGSPPFQSADPLELIHQHLAKAPPPIVPRHLSPTLHPLLHALLTVMSAIVLKLLSKQAEDRYQSTAGLIHDLHFVSTAMRTCTWVGVASGPSLAIDAAASAAIVAKLQKFQIGQLDLYSIFRISQRLYGREAMVTRLIHSYNQVSHAQTTAPPTNAAGPQEVAPQLFLISGYSGVGPSARKRHTEDAQRAR